MNQSIFYLLNEDDQSIDYALDPIYLIHNFIRSNGLNNFSIIQQPQNTMITAKLPVTGDTHSEKINYFETETIYLQQIKCDNKIYKLVVYLQQVQAEKEVN